MQRAGRVHVDAGRLERIADPLRERERMRAVAVQADRLRVERHPFARDRAHALAADHLERAREHLVFVVDERARLAARHERAVRAIAAVGEHFFDGDEPRLSRGVDEPAFREPEHRERRIEIVDRRHHRIGDLGLARGLVVQRAVRLHVRDAPAFRLSDRR